MNVAGEIEILATRDAVAVLKPKVTWAARGHIVTVWGELCFLLFCTVAELDGLSSQHH
jgi:hypothetical protein